VAGSKTNLVLTILIGGCARAQSGGSNPETSVHSLVQEGFDGVTCEQSPAEGHVAIQYLKLEVLVGDTQASWVGFGVGDTGFEPVTSSV
jgi:hypothetical protein